MYPKWNFWGFFLIRWWFRRNFVNIYYLILWNSKLILLIFKIIKSGSKFNYILTIPCDLKKKKLNQKFQRNLQAQKIHNVIPKKIAIALECRSVFKLFQHSVRIPMHTKHILTFSLQLNCNKHKSQNTYSQQEVTGIQSCHISNTTRINIIKILQSWTSRRWL